MADGTTWNILSNLNRMNASRDSYAIGICGSDYIGDKAIEALKQNGINVDGIKRRDKFTNIVYSIISQELKTDKKILYTTTSPFTKKEMYNLLETLPLDIEDELKNSPALIIIENFRAENMEFIKQFNNKKIAMDIGRMKILNKIDKDTIVDVLQKLDIVQISGEVLEELLKKLNIESIEELYRIINPDLMIITNGKNKTRFIFNQDNKTVTIEKTPRIIRNVIDTTGAGDSFFSVIINAYIRYIEQGKSIDTKFINEVFPMAQGLSEEVIKQIGGRCDNNTINNWKKSIKIEYIR